MLGLIPLTSDEAFHKLLVDDVGRGMWNLRYRWWSAFMCSKQCLGYILMVHPHLMVAEVEVELGEELTLRSSSRSSSTIKIGNVSLMVCLLRAL